MGSKGGGGETVRLHFRPSQVPEHPISHNGAGRKVKQTKNNAFLSGFEICNIFLLPFQAPLEHSIERLNKHSYEKVKLFRLVLNGD